MRRQWQKEIDWKEAERIEKEIVDTLNAEWEFIFERVCKEADRMLGEEGFWRVDGVYYASHADADKMRMIVAEKRVREAIRLEKINLNATRRAS